MKIIKSTISVISFSAAVVIGFLALFLPPLGVIHTSVLWFTAQMLLFCATILGLPLDFGALGNNIKNKIQTD